MTITILPAPPSGNDNTVRYKGLSLQIPAQRHRHHFVKVTVWVRAYADGSLALYHGPRRLADYHPDTSRKENEKSMKAA